MQGLHAFDPKAKTSIDLESCVAEDHFLRRIDRVLELSFVRELTAACYADGKGRPSIDPEVFFRMQLVAYFNGITKDRRLCEEVRYNLAYRWFCRLSLSDDAPEHSSLTRIRDRLGEAIFESVFRQLVEQCKQKGLVKVDCRVLTDATLVEADASLDSLIHNDPDQAKKEAEARRPRGLVDHTNQHRLSNKTHTSRTDPEATMCQKRGSPRHLKYKVHQTIDADSRIILDTEVTTGARHDSQPYLEQLQRVEERYNITIREATADRGYGSAEIIKALKKKGTQTYIPLWNRRVGRNTGEAAGLVYERDSDRIRCAAGKYLYPSAGDYWNRTRYASLPGQCRDCPMASTCAASNRPTAPHIRFVLRPNDQDIFDEVEAQMDDPVFKKRVSERMWKSEGLFAEAKQYHGLLRARYRGRAKVQIQAYLSAIVQNLKRLLFPLYCWLLTCWRRRMRDATHA
jgi:transposase